MRMVDTRCANPAYQLDVDELVLEYLVHDTLKAHLEGHDSNNILNEEDPITKTSNLLSILDTHIHLFKTNHPETDFSAPTTFKLKLLELVLLFSHRRGGRSLLSPGTIEEAHRRGIISLARRRESWSAYFAKYSDEASVSEERELLKIWQVFPSPSLGPVYGEYDPETKIPLIYLLPRFMDLSYELSRSMEQDVNEMWLDLATDFMTQGTIEYCEDFDVRGDCALMGAFGWGLGLGVGALDADSNGLEMDGIERGRDADLRDEERRITWKVDEMLTHKYDPDPNVTTLRWETLRREALLRFYPDVTSEDETGYITLVDSSTTLCERVLDRLKEQYPFQDFEEKLLAFISGSHALERLQPVLLQIEQGRLDGLDEDEFREFMERVGDHGY